MDGQLLCGHAAQFVFDNSSDVGVRLISDEKPSVDEHCGSSAHAGFRSFLDILADIRKDVEEGTKAGVSGTPAMFINGRLLVGNQPYADIRRIIEDELRRVAAK